MRLFERKKIKADWRPRITLPTAESGIITQLYPGDMPRQVGTHAVPEPSHRAAVFQGPQVLSRPGFDMVQHLPGTQNIALIENPTAFGITHGGGRGNPNERVILDTANRGL